MHAAKARGKPYTIVFVGVNGVGKSTSLSKVAYWLLQNGITVRLFSPRSPPTKNLMELVRAAEKVWLA